MNKQSRLIVFMPILMALATIFGIFIGKNLPSGGSGQKNNSILSGDRIVTIEGKNVAGVKIKNDQVIKTLRGKKGTKVKVEIARRNLKGVIPYTITRDKIPIYSLDAAYMVNDKIGYIKLNRFAET